MLKVEDLHIRFKQRYNILNNNRRKQFTDPEIDELLNYAIFEYVEIFLHGYNKNNYNVGFEVTQQRIDMLQPLVVSFPEQPKLPLVDNGGVYKVDLGKTVKLCKSVIAAKFEVSGCEDIFIGDPTQHKDLFTITNDYHSRSSKIWKRLVFTQRVDNLYVYPGKDIVPVSCFLSYIKVPDKVCIGTYEAYENAQIPNAINKAKSDSDLPEEYADIVLAIAEQEADRRYNNFDKMQITNQKNNQIV